MNKLIAACFIALAAPTLVSCASDTQSVARNVCPAGGTYTCTTYEGKKQRCVCATREMLEQILEPDQPH